jgi:hypothetical protein
MKIQNDLPNDSAMLESDELFSTYGFDGFFINSSAIITDKHVITTGQTYVLVWLDNRNINVHRVQLIDAYYTNNKVGLLIYNVLTKQTESIEVYFSDLNNQCPWVLIDMAYLKFEMNSIAIKAYCGCM